MWILKSSLPDAEDISVVSVVYFRKLVIADQNGGNGDKERSGRTGEEVPQGAHGFGLPVINATRVHVCFSFPAL